MLESTTETRKPRSHAGIAHKFAVRNSATHKLIVYGLYPIMSRLYWLDTWMLRMAPERTEELRMQASRAFIGLREQIRTAQREAERKAVDEHIAPEASAEQPILKRVSIEVRSPLATTLLSAVSELDKLLCQFVALYNAGTIRKKSLQDATRIWRLAVWDIIKPLQVEIEKLASEVDPTHGDRTGQERGESNADGR
jgi:hypothetical protein